MVEINGNVTYVGCTYGLWERNGYEDSDFYANCVNTQNGTLDCIEYDTTRMGGGGYAVVDLTPENYALYLHNGGKLNQLKSAIEAETIKACKVLKGKEVVVIRGRKVPHGVKGEVFWIKKVNYDRYGREWNEEEKIGIKDIEGNVYWTYAKNVEVVDYRRYLDINNVRKALKKIHGKNYLKLQGGKLWQ